MPQDTELTVNGWSPRFAKAVAKLLTIEGGYVNDPKDRGGATKYGISLRFLKAEGAFDLDRDGKKDFDLDFDGDIDFQDIRLLSLADARVLYNRCFWQKMDCDNLPRPLGEIMFDQGVNGGLHAARKMLQMAINLCLVKYESAPPQIAVDGQVGMRTLSAMNWVICWGALGMPALINAYRNVVRVRYQNIVQADPSQKRFLKGWLLRAANLGRE
jgi:lysozyme family protein